MSVRAMTSARLTDGRPQLFAGSSRGLFSNWKVDTNPDAGWIGWQPFDFHHGTVASLAAAPLTDGRPQVFAVTDTGELWTTWKVATDPNTAWADWTKFNGLPGSARSVGAATLTDGRPQIVVGTDSGSVSSWKVSMNPDDAWSDWAAFDGPPA
ncbi:hypothetical protein M2271_007864 [Streptomyces sp. LBL]|uniref:hypothetical protein n=1 Tax=Streptomyces sp. LBL TaxID=2940562 RepID=UPI002476BF9F|nr:hypothetical protein [Streptomyces sp. LBL]MDH6630014.1 hypothetical protein [Streptomyces sp. LBL]